MGTFVLGRGHQGYCSDGQGGRHGAISLAQRGGVWDSRPNFGLSASWYLLEFFLCSFELGPLGLGSPLGLGVLRDFLVAVW